jgi:DNA primase
MVPLQDPQGRVIGFTARLLEKKDGKDNNNAPKYINTPQTLLYDKSRHVYGLHLAKEAIRKSKYVVLVEGNLDVIASHQAGVRQVVATAGTALTEQNLKALSRFTDDIRLCFDADRAGVEATERAIPIASKVGVTLSIITIPSGKDPDELIKQDKNIWEQIISQNLYALDWLMQRHEALLDLNSAVGKRQFSDILLPIVRRLNDSVEQDHYMNKIAETLGVTREALTTKLLSQEKPAAKPMIKPSNPVQRADQAQLDKAQLEYIRTQDHLLSLVLLHPGLRPHAQLLNPDMLVTDRAKELFAFLQANPGFAVDLSANPGESSVEGLSQNLADYAKILLLQHEELYGDVEDLELDYEVTRLQARLIERYIKTEKAKLTAQMHEAQERNDDPATRAILMRVRELDLLRNRTQTGPSGGRNAR